MSTLKAAVLVGALMGAPAFALGNAPPDGWITTKAKLSLWTTANIKSSAVHVDTVDGVVTLYGTVNEPDQKEVAAFTVRDIKGVRGIRNLLQVVPPVDEKKEARADIDIRSEAAKALRNDPALKGSNITVKTVSRGVVLLSGKAKSISDQARAVADVDRVPGVRRVAAQIEGPEMYTKEERRLAPEDEKISPLGNLRTSLTDTRITTEVKLRLLASHEVPWNNIAVDTADGVVTLFGTVPSDPAKAAANEIASKVPGVMRVLNELEIHKTNEHPQPAISDEAIAHELDQRFRGVSQFKHVGYSVKDGAVRLTGTIDSGWDRLEAVRAARSVHGVTTVHDDLMMAGTKQETPVL
jgi:osmotically-inducible protein OsmY